jgi:tRNA (guanine-N7-)-methyltransferase
LHGYPQFAFDEERCLTLKGRWRDLAFQQSRDFPLDVEIGTGIGQFFAARSRAEPGRGLVGFELKYKPLIQSIRRALRAQALNARVVRYNARLLRDVFCPDEINDVFIHFPDPWHKKRGTEKHRLLEGGFLDELYGLQRPGSFVDFKTDSRVYMEMAIEKATKSLYTIERQTFDLHRSSWAAENFRTPFEEYFLRDGVPINYLRLRRL